MPGIYIHIPFCKQACNYCNFYFSTSLQQKENFIAALLKEISLQRDFFKNPDEAGRRIETLYFGGGTPSLLSKSDFEIILAQLHRYFDLSGLREFTIEANPDDLTETKVQEFAELKKSGLNRFSVGIQSLYDEDLRYMNRAHNSAEALQCLKRLQDKGFDNLSADLIYGTPTLSDEHWLQNLATITALNIPHISSYALTVEAKTLLSKKIAKGEMTAVSDTHTAKHFQVLMDVLKAKGYEHYEISNFAQPGKYALHNTNYWRGKKYLGLGPSAHSYNGNSRQWNMSNNLIYIKSIAENKLPVETEILTAADKANEHIMTSLRTMWGLNLNDAGVVDFREGILKSLQMITPSFYTLNTEIVKLTEEGKFYADRIASELFVE